MAIAPRSIRAPMVNCTTRYRLGEAAGFDFLVWLSIMEGFDGSVPAATTLVRNRPPLSARNRLPNAHPRENNCNITNSVVTVVAQEQLDFAPLYPFTEKPRSNPFGSRSLSLLPVAVSDREQ